MSVCVEPRCRDVPHVRVQVQRLGIGKVCIRHSRRFRGPIGRDEPAQAIRVISRPKIIQPRFRVAFFAGKFVMIGGDLLVVFFAVGQEGALPHRPAAVGGHQARRADLVAVVVHGRRPPRVRPGIRVVVDFVAALRHA